MTLKLQANNSSLSLKTSSLSFSEGENKNIMSEFSGVFKKQDAVEVWILVLFCEILGGE